MSSFGVLNAKLRSVKHVVVCLGYPKKYHGGIAKARSIPQTKLSQRKKKKRRLRKSQGKYYLLSPFMTKIIHLSFPL